MILFVILFSILILLYIKYSLKKRKYMKNVPGPKPNLFFGNTLDALVLETHEYLDGLINYLNIYGKTILVHDGPLSQLLISMDPEFAEHILGSTKVMKKNIHYSFLESWLGTGLLTCDGAKWKTRRRLLTPSFHFENLQNYVEIFDNVSNIFIEQLQKEVGKDSADINDLVSLMTLDIICETAMNVKINAQIDSTSAYVKAVHSMCSIIAERFFSPIHPILYPLTMKYFQEKFALRILDAKTNEIIEKRMKEFKDNGEKNETGKKKKSSFLDTLLGFTVDGKRLTKSEIREEVNTFMLGGQDSSAALISFAMYELSLNPEVQEKVFLEQKQIFDVLKNAKPTIPQLQQMKYLELVIKETLRLYPPIPLLGRSLSEDLEWDGNLYPKGLTITFFPFGMHRNPEYFKDPLEFIPERFEGMKLNNPYAYIPFSAGPRNCIGQKFAMLVLKIVLSKVVRNFELRPAKPAHILKLAPNVVLASKNGVCVSLAKRNLD